MGTKKKGALVAASKMTALVEKDTAQQEQGILGTLDQDLLRQIKQLMLESEQRISSQLLHIGTKTDDLQQQILGINSQMGELKQETDQLKKEIKAVDVDTKLLKSTQQDLNTSYFRMLYDRSLYRLRIQNLPESKEERIDEKVIKWLSEVSPMSEQVIQQATDVIFRVQSKQAKKIGMGREVMVKFSSRGIRDKIFERTAYKDHLFADQRILILKDVPYEIRQRRLPYKELTTSLSDHQVKYRWLIPEGLSFTFKEKSQEIKSLEDLNRFQKDNAEMFRRRIRQDTKKKEL